MSKSQVVVKKLSLVRESVKTLRVRSGIETGNIPPEKMGGAGNGTHAPPTGIPTIVQGPGGFAESRH